MISIFIQGALLSDGLIIAIGAQNASMLRQGLLGQKVLYACTVCFIGNAVLITPGILGVGAILQRAPFFLDALAMLGAIFFAAMAVTLFSKLTKGIATYMWGRGAINSHLWQN